DDLVGFGQAAEHLELGAKIAAELYRLELDLVSGAKKRKLRTILAKDQGAGRDPQRAGAVGEVEADLGEGARLQEIAVVVGVEFDQQGARRLVDGLRRR